MEGKESSAVCLRRPFYLCYYLCKYTGEWKGDAVWWIGQAEQTDRCYLFYCTTPDTSLQEPKSTRLSVSGRPAVGQGCAFNDAVWT